MVSYGALYERAAAGARTGHVEVGLVVEATQQVREATTQELHITPDL